MKSKIKKICTVCLQILLPLLIAFFVRAGMILLLYRLFDKWNLCTDTLSIAPSWMRSLWLNAAYIANIAAIVFGLTATVFINRKHNCSGGIALKAATAGFLYAVIPLALFVAVDSVRFYRFSLDLSILTYFLLPAFAALILRGSIQLLGLKCIWGYVLSALLQLGLAFMLQGYNILLLVNSALFGVCACFLLYKTATPFTEAVFSAVFGLVSRGLLGFPDAGIYPVSEDIITGGNYGLEASAFTTLIFIVFLFLCRKEVFKVGR